MLQGKAICVCRLMSLSASCEAHCYLGIPDTGRWCIHREETIRWHRLRSEDYIQT